MSPLLLGLLLESAVPTSPGVHEARLQRDAGEPVLYTLSIPEGFEADEPHPLVLALHFAGRNRPHFGRGILEGLVEPALRDLGALIVAPDSLGGGWTSSKSERAVLDLLDFLGSSYRIDPERVLVTGYSMGGMGTWYLAARHPDRFTAAIPLAGAPRALSDEELRVLTGLPLYAIHSIVDTVVPSGATEVAIGKLRSWEAANVELVLVDDITHYDVPGFRPYLLEAGKWLRRVWGQR